MVRRNGRNNGIARWDTMCTMYAGSFDDKASSGHAFFLGEGARQIWRKRGNIGSRRKYTGGRRRGFSIVDNSSPAQIN
ncbi:hypothetical protein ACP70R_041333 [Stipagrostis hirtigluma subsp. patula]